ncbi:MAG: hypothetical protein K5776_07650, partial [Lachnospiraceae bacterium]|nr:hypothetical protein [Lachnospiraceae bacterium]
MEKMKKVFRLKKILSSLLILVITFATVAGVTGIKASADGNQGRESVNVHDHDYTRWSHVSNSYMYFDGDNP